MKLKNFIKPSSVQALGIQSGFVLMLLVLLISNATQAQTPMPYVVERPEAIRLVKSCTLAVVRKEPEEDLLRKFSDKPEKLAKLKKLVDDYNGFLEAAVRTEWKLSPAVIFISEAEADAFKKAGDKNVCLMETTEMAGPTSYAPQGYTTKIDKRDALAYDMEEGLGIPILKIVWAQEPKDKDILTLQIIPEVNLSEASMIWCVQQLSNKLLDAFRPGVTSVKEFNRYIDTRTATLKDKTLLICEEFIDDDFKKQLNSGKIDKDDCPFAVELVSIERLNEILKSHDEKYAYAWVIPNLYRWYDFLISDAADGHWLWYTSRSPVRRFTMEHVKGAGKAAKR